MTIFTASHNDDDSSENTWFDTFGDALDYARGWADESELDLATFYIIEANSKEAYAQGSYKSCLSL